VFILLTLEEIAKRAAREANSDTRVYVSPDLIPDLRPFLKNRVQIVSCDNGMPDVDIAFVKAIRVCTRGDILEPSEITNVNPCQTTHIPSCKAKRIVVLMPSTQQHSDILVHCQKPKMGNESINNCRIITELAVLDITQEGVVIREVAPGTSAKGVQEITPVPLWAGPDLDEIKF